VKVLVTVMCTRNVANSTKCNCIFTVHVGLPYAYVIPEGSVRWHLVSYSAGAITMDLELRLRVLRMSVRRCTEAPS